MQWGAPAWALLMKYSQKRVVDLKVGTKEAATKKPKMAARQDGSKGKPRKAPEMTVAFIMKLLIIVSAMGVMRLPARKYYWSQNILVGNTFIRSIMSQTQFEQGMRCLASFDPDKLVPRGDKKLPPPIGYDKMAKTRELDNLVMQRTLSSYCPDTKLANDECSEDHTSGKNGEGACITFNKDKPLKWATRVQSFNSLDGTRVVWQTMSCPLRVKSPHGTTYESTMALGGLVHGMYGEGFKIGEDSAYTSPVQLVDMHVKYKWNCYGTVSWNRYGILQGEVDGTDTSEVSSTVQCGESASLGPRWSRWARSMYPSASRS